MTVNSVAATWFCFDLGVDYDTIVDVLTNRSREQRQLISRAFQERTKQVRPLTSQELWTGWGPLGGLEIQPYPAPPS